VNSGQRSDENGDLNFALITIRLKAGDLNPYSSLKVRELTRMLAREGFLWCEPTQVSQQALSQRFLTFPAEIFESIFNGLPELIHLRSNKQLYNRRYVNDSTLDNLP
jgi:hypothetical protein